MRNTIFAAAAAFGVLLAGQASAETPFSIFLGNELKGQADAQGWGEGLYPSYKVGPLAISLRNYTSTFVKSDGLSVFSELNGINLYATDGRPFDLDYFSIVGGQYSASQSISVVAYAAGDMTFATAVSSSDGGTYFDIPSFGQRSTFKVNLKNVQAVAFLIGMGNFTLSDITGASAVPEPATWAMMLVGFGMIGATARYRRRKASVSFA